jgi:methionyl-tRNA formyltransferase
MGCTGLEFLLGQGEDVPAVITHREDPAEKRWYRSLGEVAARRGVPVLFGEEIDLESEVARLAPEMILSFYYRSMIPMPVLWKAPGGALNLHGSLLPRLRGRAPINWALVEGEEETGVTLHHMVKAPDAGDIVAQRGWKIGACDTAKDLFFRAVYETKILLQEIWPRIQAGTAPRIPQDPLKATYRGRRRPEDGRIDWTQSTRRIDGLVRAVTDPFPGAFTSLQGKKLRVWAGSPAAGRGSPGVAISEAVVATGDGAYRIERWHLAEDPASRPVLSPGTKLGELA